MNKTSLRALLRSKGLKVGTSVFEFDSPGIGQIIKAAGADYVFVDMEHSGFGIDTLKRILRYMQSADLLTIVRPLTKAAHHIGQVLDAGADGVLIPMVETAEEARQAISAMKYLPQGNRGAALGIAHDRYRASNMKETFAAANENIAAIILIESAEGIKNVDQIAAIDGVDGLWLGGLDLSCSLGCLGEFDGNPVFDQAVTKLLDATKKHNINAGRLTFAPEEGINLFKAGFDAISYSADIYLLRSAIEQGISKIKAQ